MKKKNQTIANRGWWLIVTTLFAAGTLTGIIADRIWTEMKITPPTLILKREGGYTLINPLLMCDNAEEIIGDPEIKPFKHKIAAYIDDAMNKKRASDVSVYFRDLTNGPSFGINADERFSPASLFKVPIMIAYFKLAESRPAILKDQLVYDGKQDLNRMENFKASHAIEPGKKYTVEKLIEMMIVYSDNNAMNLLVNHMDMEFMYKVYQDIGIVMPAAAGRNFMDDFMSVEEYTSCFRILFNSSYLNRELSERALRYLAEPDFPQGIMGGVPHDITVAQKYGERAFAETNVKELHDCGIVYYPNMPYLLCIMSKGTDFNVLAETIKNISAMVFDEVDKGQKEYKAQSHR